MMCHFCKPSIDRGTLQFNVIKIKVSFSKLRWPSKWTQISFCFSSISFLKTCKANLELEPPKYFPSNPKFSFAQVYYQWPILRGVDSVASNQGCSMACTSIFSVRTELAPSIFSFRDKVQAQSAEKFAQSMPFSKSTSEF